MTEIASKAGVDKYTAHRCLRGEVDTRSSKASAIEAAIAREELDLLAHLVRVHPDQAAALIPSARAA